MFRVIQLQDKSVQPVLCRWLIFDNGCCTGCYWPLAGFSFKIKNFVSPPLELNIQERKEWKVLKCKIILNGSELISNSIKSESSTSLLTEEFATYEEASTAALRIFNEPLHEDLEASTITCQINAIKLAERTNGENSALTEVCVRRGQAQNKYISKKLVCLASPI